MVEVFKKRGYRIHANMDETTPQAANGVGGKSTPIGKALVPRSLIGCGAIEFLILDHPCPPLMPARYLDFIHAVVDLQRDVLSAGKGKSRADIVMFRFVQVIAQWI
eukprot:5937829-Pyramimonas_sp.AAC.1